MEIDAHPRYVFDMRFLVLVCAFAIGAPALAASPAPQMSLSAVKQADALFPKLAKAGSAENAKPLEATILSLFNQSGSPSIDLLMVRAAAALHDGDTATAGKLAESITEIAPGFAEGWHVRGELAQAANDDTAAIAYLNKAISLNPRQFEACAELAGILAEYGDKKQALQYFRKAQALDPWLEGVGSQVQKLARDVEGEKI